jgi:hypothetical protein
LCDSGTWVANIAKAGESHSPVPLRGELPGEKRGNADRTA